MDAADTPNVGGEEVEADGYYLDEADSEELDLSFLDEEDEADEEAADEHVKSDSGK